MHLNALRVFSFFSTCTLISQKELGSLDEGKLTRDVVPLFEELLLKVLHHTVANCMQSGHVLDLAPSQEGFTASKLNCELTISDSFQPHKKQAPVFTFKKK